MRIRRMAAYGALTVAALAALIGLWHVAADRPQATAWVTEPATVGTLVVTVSATGTLQPTKSVDVGSELSGTGNTVRRQLFGGRKPVGDSLRIKGFACEVVGPLRPRARGRWVWTRTMWWSCR